MSDFMDESVIRFAIMVNEMLDDHLPELDESEKMTALSMVIAMRARLTFPNNCHSYTQWARVVGEAVSFFPEGLDFRTASKDLKTQ